MLPGLLAHSILSATVYEVGPNQPLQSLGAVPWDTLEPGDTVNIHFQAGGYHEIILLSNSGTPSEPITIRGVPDPLTGALPIIDGENATTRAGTPWRSSFFEDQGVIVISRKAGTTWGYKPSHIRIEKLHIRNGNKQFMLTRGNGQTVPFSSFASGIYVEFAEHLTIRHCEISGCGNGLFINSKNGGGGATQEISDHVLIEHCHIHDNGHVSSFSEHNIYTETAGITFQYNVIGPNASGAHGEGIKDRSAGTVIRYNKILTGKNGVGHAIWILQTQGGKGMIDQQPDYHTTHIYGNVIYNAPGGGSAMVRYSAGAEDIRVARRGPHYFYHNTLVNHANQTGPNGRWYTVALITPQQWEVGQLGWTAIVDCRNNILANLPETAGAKPSDFYLLGSDAGDLRLGANWISAGYIVFRLPFGGSEFFGTITGADQLIVGTDPKFADLAALDFHLANGSPAIDRAAALPAELIASFDVNEEILDPISSRPRKVAGIAADLGAFESDGTNTPPLPKPGTIQFFPENFSTTEKSGAAVITVSRDGGSDGAVSVQWSARSGSAVAPGDFVAATGELAWSPGEGGLKSFVVTIVDDALAEGPETVFLSLDQPAGGATIGNAATARLTIADDDISEPGNTNGPAAASAFLQMTGISRRPDGSVVLRWTSETNAFSPLFFTLMGASHLPALLDLPGLIPASQPFTTVTNDTFSASERSFFRIKAAPVFVPMSEPRAWSAHDAGSVGGLNTKGYVGGVFDGRFIYFVPYQDGAAHARVLRLDTRGDFEATSSWSAFDAGGVGGFATRGYCGGVFDGRYVYFSPAWGGESAGKVLRLDTRNEFTNATSWAAFDASKTDQLDTFGFQGAVFDGRFVYFVPHYNTTFNGSILRYDTTAAFEKAQSWSAYDAGKTSGLATIGYSGGIFDGRHVYFAPVFDGTNTHARVLRHDTKQEFNHSASWLAYDAGQNSMLMLTTRGFKGGVFDGRFIYFVPYVGNHQVLRFDTSGEFTTHASWAAFDTAALGENGTKGFMGGAFDGRYVWFAPYFDDAAHGKVLRYDTTMAFELPSSWSAYDAGATGGISAKGFQGAVFDGRHLYFVPYRAGAFHGVVLRVDARLPRDIPKSVFGGSFY
ncbi:MAG: Calx-beta domain-containing protein [Verrucomicrobiota bacterium]